MNPNKWLEGTHGNWSAFSTAVSAGSCHRRWRAATWNAAGDVNRFEFLPLPDQLANRIERLVGAAVLRLAGVGGASLVDAKGKCWARYAVGGECPEAPCETDVRFLAALSIAELLQGLEPASLLACWGQWVAQNPGGEADVDRHLRAWRSAGLADIFRTAMDSQPEGAECEEANLAVPGLRSGFRALISGPDKVMSQRAYQMRGTSWLAFLQDASNSDFSEQNFWDKWVQGLQTCCAKDKPVVFAPSQPHADYAAIAVWDRFLFLAARQAMAGTRQLDEVWSKLQDAVDIPKDKLKIGRENVIKWATDPGGGALDALFLQEATPVEPPQGWRAFPAAGSATAVLLPEGCVDEQATQMAEAALVDAKKDVLKTIEEWEQIERRMSEELQNATSQMRLAVKDILQDLSVEDDVAESMVILADDKVNRLEMQFEGLRTGASEGQLMKIRKWFSQEKIAVAVAQLRGERCLLLSGHAESMGTTCVAVLALAHALREELLLQLDDAETMSVIVGMDSNVKVSNKGAAASPERLGEAAASLGFYWTKSEQLLQAGCSKQATYTVLKTRCFLQPQLADKAGVPDRNLKDWLFYLPPAGRAAISEARTVRDTPTLWGKVVNAVGPEFQDGSFCEGGMPRGADFPSDHALMVVTACDADNAGNDETLQS